MEILLRVFYFIDKFTNIVGVTCSRHSSYVECNGILTRLLRSFDKLLFKFNVSLPLVTGELMLEFSIFSVTDIANCGSNQSCCNLTQPRSSVVRFCAL